MKNALIIFVRNPVLGKVKTRLAATLGDQAALDIYNQLLDHTFAVCKQNKADKFVFYHQNIWHEDRWQQQDFFKKLQHGVDLGEKMKNAFAEVFEEGYQKVIIIGSDCLQLTAEIIADAFTKLDSHDAALGPAKDGGYYLLGMKKLIPSVFENKQWSTASVFENTLQDLNSLDLETAVLLQLTDVDTEADWMESKKNNHAL